MFNIVPLSVDSRPNSHCDIHGCPDPVAFAIENTMTKGKYKGTKRRRLVCDKHTAQFAEKHNIYKKE